MGKLKQLLNLIEKDTGLDFKGYHKPMLKRRIAKRLFKTNCADLDAYIAYTIENPNEYQELVNVFTINVSHFFRNALTFEYLRKFIFRHLISDFNENKKTDLRIWSAGCAMGEEPYSIAIIIKELLLKEKISLNTNIFATDIDKITLQKAKEGIYSIESVVNVKYGILNKYFTLINNQFRIDSEIKKMVQFSYYDLLDKNNTVPSESIFGGFDVVICRNVLIYFNSEYQEIVYTKLYNSLNKDGILILGETESIADKFKPRFTQISRCCKIYRKIY